MSTKNTLGNRVRAAREAAGLTQMALAKKLRVSGTAVWNWEANGVHPRPAMLSALAKVLGVSEAYLVSGEVQKTAPARTAMQIIQAAAEEIAALNGVPVSRVKIDWQIQ
jgi:HTH-type transcriptional regulator, cell division transcriptional repressor